MSRFKRRALVGTGLEVNGNGSLTGDLSVSGTMTAGTISSIDLATNDSFIVANANQTGNTRDFGIVSKYVSDSTAMYAGLVYDSSDTRLIAISDLQSVSGTALESLLARTRADIECKNLIFTNKLLFGTAGINSSYMVYMSGGNVRIQSDTKAYIDMQATEHNIQFSDSVGMKTSANGVQMKGNFSAGSSAYVTPTSSAFPFRFYRPTETAKWSGMHVGGDGNQLVLGTFNTTNTPTIGAHSSALDAWAELTVNGGGMKTNMGGPLVLASYTVAGLPGASGAGQLVYVSNESGGAVVAFSDGVNWRRVTDRAIVS
jgi:hypothetical protein